MKNRSHSVQGHTYPRPLPFTDLATCGDEQRLDVPPRDTGADRISKNSLKGRVVLST